MVFMIYIRISGHKTFLFSSKHYARLNILEISHGTFSGKLFYNTFCDSTIFVKA